jgi:hypothetical protein
LLTYLTLAPRACSFSSDLSLCGPIPPEVESLALCFPILSGNWVEVFALPT